MRKSAVVTIRITAALKRRLEARARAQHRSLSAQVAADLETLVGDAGNSGLSRGRFLGRFEGTKLPSHEDIEEVRALLWGDLGRRQGRG